MISMMLMFCVTDVFAQCMFTITDEESYFEDFESGQMECWEVVDATGNATWTVMTGTVSSVAAFVNAAEGDVARLVSPTFDLSGVGSATFSFSYAMMGYINADLFVVSYRTSETDSWHELASYNFSDWNGFYEASFTLPDLSPTYQISFLGHNNGGYYIFVDNIEIASAGGCARPVSLAASQTTPTTALLEWSTTGNEESWELELDGVSQTVYEQPYLLEGLEPNTEYSFRVKANCGGGSESLWALPVTFKTQCDVIVVTDDQPYFDDFEASDDFVCWQSIVESGNYGWSIDPGYTIVNNTAFFFWMGEQARLVSAPLDITAVTSPTLTFKHRQRMIDGLVDELSVWYGTSATDYWHLLGEFTEVCADWETVSFALPDKSATYYICFLATANNADGVYVDDVWVGHDANVGLADVLEPEVTEGAVMVYDLYGRHVATGQLVEGHLELNRDDLARGVYVARISGDNGIITRKIIKE